MNKISLTIIFSISALILFTIPETFAQPMPGDLIIAENSGSIYKQDPNGGPPELIASGVGRLQGITIHPGTGDIFVVVSGPGPNNEHPVRPCVK